ncbi:MAG TPA: hypothetical protein P5072_02880, partial [Parvularculaceae bacterium]|nr:hypothetical protein [Parvularculaceae bacterium]
MQAAIQSSVDETILKEVLTLAKKEDVGDLNSKGETASAFANYASQIVRFATGEDSIWEDPRALLERAAAAWNVSQERKPGEHLIRLSLNKAEDWR